MNEVTNNSQVIDWHSRSNASKIHPDHLILDLQVDFDHKELQGSASWLIHADETVEEAIFDTYQLDIEAVENEAGQALSYELGKEDPILGRPLKIKLSPHPERLIIHYKITKEAMAVQWLEKEQTFGKSAPFLYTQGESIYGRSWFPCPDSPGYRFSYEATIQTPKGLMALMSAENPQELNPDGFYQFKMEEKIPAYLVALAVGAIGFKAVDARTGVYAEEKILEKAYQELEDLGKMVETAESLYGPYRWGRYDVLVLPLGFPLGGMENPRLTFCTPTILAGDKSLVNLIAHELAHSWSGNLVTNATWNDFWLNEGFTVYFERRITEAQYGQDYVAMLWDLGFKDLKEDLALIKEKRDTRLKNDLKGRDPDIGFTDVAYEKGSGFLLRLEQLVGRAALDRFLINYFNDHAFQSMTTEKFVGYLKKHLLSQQPDWASSLDLEEWLYGEGLPKDFPTMENVRFEKVETQVATYLKQQKASALKTEAWSTAEWQHFLSELPDDLSHAQMEDLDQAFDLTHSGNSEIIDLWFLHAIHSDYSPAYPALEKFLIETGRTKFLTPLYRALKATSKGKQMAQNIYQQARPNYHPLTQKKIDDLLSQ